VPHESGHKDRRDDGITERPGGAKCGGGGGASGHPPCDGSLEANAAFQASSRMRRGMPSVLLISWDPADGPSTACM